MCVRVVVLIHAITYNLLFILYKLYCHVEMHECMHGFIHMSSKERPYSSYLHTVLKVISGTRINNR